MIVRKGIKEDVPQVLDLIKELAEYEKALDQVSNTVERLENDGFGKSPVYDLFVAEAENKIIGIAITFFRYSTWKGKNLYIEDLVVSENFRRKGVGSKLIDEFRLCVIWISLIGYMDLTKLLHGFVRFVLCISRPLPNKS